MADVVVDADCAVMEASTFGVGDEISIYPGSESGQLVITGIDITLVGHAGGVCTMVLSDNAGAVILAQYAFPAYTNTAGKPMLRWKRTGIRMGISADLGLKITGGRAGAVIHGQIFVQRVA